MKQRKDPRAKRNKIIFGVFLSLIMITSLGGFLVGQTSSDNGIPVKIGDKDYKFYPKETYYSVRSDAIGRDVEFYSLPSQVESVEVPKEVLDLISSAQGVTIVIDPTVTDLSYMEFFRYQMNIDLIRLNKFVQNGVSEQTDKYDLPIMGCENATISNAVIDLRESNLSRIYAEGNCVIVESTALGFVKARDKIAYHIYGFLNE